MTGRLSSMKRVVVKIGSQLLIDGDSGQVDGAWLEALGADLAAMHGRGQDVLIVSSGAIALGRSALGLSQGILKLEDSQASAAVGQIALAHAYRDMLHAHGLSAAQILLTLNDTEERRRYLNARSTLTTLLKLGAIPVINENDTVATSEIRYGDNDRLAARVAGMISADCLVLLSNVDGLYTASPDTGNAGSLLREINDITPEIEAMAGGSGSNMGSGGMITKIEAARISTNAGAHMVIADGRIRNPLSMLEKTGKGTWFVPKTGPAAARKRWISGALEPYGTLVVDDGAAKALRSGKSLLPAGVVEVSGTFSRGDAIAIVDPDGIEIGRGLSAYDHEDAHRIIGHKSGEIQTILGYRGRDEIIHRDDLFLIKG